MKAGMKTVLIGIDAATVREKCGYAIGELIDDVLHVKSAGVLKSKHCPDALAAYVMPELVESQRVLLAIDAPLGWPAAAGVSLSAHLAGQVLKCAPDQLFHRATDEFVFKKQGRRPLEVGANLIARTAHAALKLLEDIRQKSGYSIPLVWTLGFDGMGAIEVYPAASLRAWGVDFKGYRDSRDSRARLLKGLDRRIYMPPTLSEIVLGSVDALDACLCALAACDFLAGAVWEPEDPKVAPKEGWIWFRRGGLPVKSNGDN
jgi:predicted nuclease with RNAse H fold